MYSIKELKKQQLLKTSKKLKKLFHKEHWIIRHLEKIKPDYVVHGDDWKSGIQ